jgi:GDP-mannose 6-dehydrogenase
MLFSQYRYKAYVDCDEIMAKVSVFGLGYVGSVTAACLASQGHSVIGVDVNPLKVEQIQAGRTPVVEPGIAELVEQSHRASRLSATTETNKAVLATDISLLCVGTPSLRNGNLDLGHLEPVCRSIGEALCHKRTFHLIVLRSTVLPGTAESIVIPALQTASGKRFCSDFGVCVNPEFMREGSAVPDFMEPSMTVIGASNPGHAAKLRELYEWAPGRLFETSFRAAEMVKYLCNAWHALKVAFANEAGSLAKELGVDAESVFEIFCADNRLNISPSYLKPGFAFGGSCLPKDVRALNYRAKELDLELPILESILTSNDQHFRRALDMVLRTGKRKIALLGLSFKAGTDDLRESPQVQLAKNLLGEGCELTIWDDTVLLGQLIASNREYIERTIPHIASLLRHDLTDAVRDAEAVIVATRVIPRQVIERSLRPEQIVIDLVNLEKACRVQANGKYEGLCW